MFSVCPSQSVSVLYTTILFGIIIGDCFVCCLFDLNFCLFVHYGYAACMINSVMRLYYVYVLVTLYCSSQQLFDEYNARPIQASPSQTDMQWAMSVLINNHL